MSAHKPSHPDPDVVAVTVALAAAVGIDIPQTYRAGVEIQFARIAAIAARVMAHPLDEAAEPAAVFRHD